MEPWSASMDFFGEVNDHEFRLVNSSQKINVDDMFVNEEFMDIAYKLTLERRTSYATHLFVAPTVVICLIIPVMFLLPPESAQKITLGRLSFSLNCIIIT